jgi:hypothetical protein
MDVLIHVFNCILANSFRFRQMVSSAVGSAWHADYVRLHRMASFHVFASSQNVICPCLLSPDAIGGQQRKATSEQTG